LARQLECKYDTRVDETRERVLKRKRREIQTLKSPYEQVFDALRDRSEADAILILSKVQAGETIRDNARQIEHGDLLL
jgi:hypothetical protein